MACHGIRVTLLRGFIKREREKYPKNMFCFNIIIDLSQLHTDTFLRLTNLDCFLHRARVEACLCYR